MRFLPAGPTAVLVEVEGLSQVLGLQAEIDRRRAGGWAPSLVDVVVGARTVLLDGTDDPAGLARDMRSWSVPAAPQNAGPAIEIACWYQGPDLAEIKSMHTAEAARGRGVGRAMLAHLLAVARARGFRRVKLETGTTAAFAPARMLYHSAGFVPCGPFGGYRPSDDNTFMTLELDALQETGS